MVDPQWTRLGIRLGTLGWQWSAALATPER
jgi:hypothetical protein